MSLLVVGSIALDSITTPFGARESILGGAASFFSVGARHFSEVDLVGVIGEDFPAEHVAFFKSLGINLAGLERRTGGKTFRWTGRYQGRMDVAESLKTELNVLGSFKPTLPPALLGTSFAFLANTDPVTQLHVRKQLKEPRFVLLDTMNFWIDSARPALYEAMRAVDGVIMNDDEARSLAAEPNLIRAMTKIAAQGVRTLIIKKGEHGSVVLSDGQLFALPAYPLEEVKDPTGAGDSFASGFMGCLAEREDISFASLKLALAYGTVVASYTVEGFGLERLRTITREDIERRLAAFLAFTRF